MLDMLVAAAAPRVTGGRSRTCFNETISHEGKICRAELSLRNSRTALEVFGFIAITIAWSGILAQRKSDSAHRYADEQQDLCVVRSGFCLAVRFHS